MKNLKKQIKSVNAARSQYNPLRGITLQRAVSLLEEGERGIYADLQWLYRTIEKRDAVLRALKRRRSAALMKLEWNIKTVPADQMPDGVTEEQAEAQAEALRKLYEQIENLYAAIKALALAEFRGFAHLEKIYINDRPAPDAIRRLEPLAQWHWCRDGYESPWRFNPELHAAIHSADEVETVHLVIREIDDPIDEIALIAFLRKNMSQKDWDGFVEVFGIPDIFFEMPQGMTTEQTKEWMATAEQLAGDGQGAIPNGGKVQSVGGDVRGTNPFESHISYQDTCVVLAGTGGKLTMLSEPPGLGEGATGAHDDAFDDLAAEEAREISELLQNSLDKPLLAAKFPGQPVLAYFDLSARTEEDVTEIIGHIKSLSEAGFAVAPEEVTERTGYHVEAKPQPQNVEYPMPNFEGKNRQPWFKRFFNRKSAIGNRQSPDPQEQLLKNARTAIATAVKNDMEPVAARLAEILDADLTDDELLQALEKFQVEELPKFAKDILAAPSSVDAIADTLSAGLFNGMAEESAARGQKSENGGQKA
jgi:phage gp29-like protein